MRRLLAVAALPLLSAAPVREPRIVSINPCIDAVLMQVADPAQIAGISHYSQDPRATSIPLAQALRFKATSGTAEEVVALAPDVVMSGPHVAPATLAALKRMRIRLVQYPVPDSVAESEEQVRDIARIAGHASRGEGAGTTDRHGGARRRGKAGACADLAIGRTGAGGGDAARRTAVPRRLPQHERGLRPQEMGRPAARISHRAAAARAAVGRRGGGGRGSPDLAPGGAAARRADRGGALSVAVDELWRADDHRGDGAAASGSQRNGA